VSGRTVGPASVLADRKGELVSWTPERRALRPSRCHKTYPDLTANLGRNTTIILKRRRTQPLVSVPQKPGGLGFASPVPAKADWPDDRGL